MVSLKRALRYIRYNRSQFCDSFVKNFLRFLPDKMYLSLRFRFQMGYWMNWKAPKTFSEKLQWLKVYDRKPEYTKFVDKYSVKDHVASIIGEEYIIPTLGIWDSLEDIDWSSLPEKFVLKTTHGGGSTGVVICKDKNSFDKRSAVTMLGQSMRSDIYKGLREWPYKDVNPRILAEEYIADEKMSDLPDYKIFTFNGEPKFCQVIAGRGHVMTVDFYDLEWNHQPFHEPRNTDFAPKAHARPVNFDKMLELAALLAKGTSFLRVDFYDVNGKVYFGELTFFPTSGFGGFDPIEWDAIFGSWIQIPN